VVVAVVEVSDCVPVVLGTVPCVCADAKTVAAKMTMARDTFFTRVLNLGEIKTFPILYMLRDTTAE